MKRQLVNMLDYDTSAKDSKRALAYAQDLVRMQPKKSGAYSVLGGVYLNLWHKSGDVQAARSAIRNYQKYLQLAPDSFPWNKQAKKLIKIIEKELNESGRE